MNNKHSGLIIALVIIVFILLVIFLYISFVQTINVKRRSLKRKSKYNGKKLLVVPNFNPQGGLHWMLYCIMAASHQARKYNLKLVVIYDSGLYFENRREFMEPGIIDPNNNEWFSYYFEPIGIQNEYVNYLWKTGVLPNNVPSLAHYKKEQSRLDSEDFVGFKFDREAFDTRDHNVNYNREWDECMVLRPYLEKQIGDFGAKHFELDSLVIGAHIRGTDKYGNASDSEDGPKHFKYEDYCKELAIAPEKWVKELGLSKNVKVYVFICSDEQPFIDFATKYLQEHGVNVVSTGDMVFRSPISTSGLELNSHLCGGPLGDAHPDCKIYRDLANASVHRGFQDQSKYKKGWDAVFEVSLLSRYCRVFYKSRGNFSSSVGKSNGKIREIDWVDYLTEKLKKDIK